jgi:hypothetical protein
MRAATLQHDEGLVASPPVRYILKWGEGTLAGVAAEFARRIQRSIGTSNDLCKACMREIQGEGLGGKSELTAPTLSGADALHALVKGAFC